MRILKLLSKRILQILFVLSFSLLVNAEEQPVDIWNIEKEKVNLLYWQVTCECFFTTEEWKWLFKEAGYKGDYSFIFFE